MPPELQGQSKPKGANRSTKAAGKLKVLPEQPEPPEPPVVDLKSRARREHLEEGHDESGTATATAGESDEGDIDEDSDEMESVEVYNQISLIPEGTARRDAMRLTKKKAKSLPRVTAYATASSFRMDDVMKFLNARRNAYHTNPKLIDEVIYSPYSYHGPTNDDAQNSSNMSREADLLGVPELRPSSGDEMRTFKRKGRFDASNTEAEIYIFDYGTVVVWGMSEAQEKRLLSSLRRFEVEPLAPDDVEMEDLNYYYANYSRIYNDVITLRKGSGYMCGLSLFSLDSLLTRISRTKLSLSHALSQSVKISLFESLISNTIEETKDIPEIISETGKIGMPHKEIMQQIGQLFLLRSNINSVGSVLDSPEVFWSFPDQQPLYDAARSYLEIPQRINLLNTRVEVMSFPSLVRIRAHIKNDPGAARYVTIAQRIRLK
ncbi:sporulation protein rmd1 [Marasmius tenuissimus]|uniref:Sporulation protein rmd1 n=1 Tax=Marasmius tenuissimus TaxID=585030 RepID=A0ABR3AA96_9AGAR